MRNSVCALVFFYTTLICTANDAVNKKIIDDAVKLEISQGLIPGAVVLVGNKNGPVFSSAYGYAQLGNPKVPMQLNTLFDVASITKVVATATACAILYDQGKFNPDAKMPDYLKGLSGKGVEKISFRDLGSHTSGFASDPRIGARGKGAEFFKVLFAESPTWERETKYQYACKGTIFMSSAVESISGKKFGEFCSENILSPLEMHDSSFNKAIEPKRAASSHFNKLGFNHNIDAKSAGCAVGNAGLFTTALDLSNFCQMMLNKGLWKGKRILSEKVIQEFTKKRTDTKFPGRSFIWEINTTALHRPTLLSEKAYGHSGYTGMSIWIDPGTGLYTIILTNRTAVKGHSKIKDEQYKARSRIGDALIKALKKQ